MGKLEAGYIYESPDGIHVFRRPVGDYDNRKKEEINLDTGKPTGRMFNEYPFKQVTTEEKIRNLVYKTPNDMELGQKVRYLFPLEQKASDEYLEFWTCELCGEHTHEVDYDYLGSGTNHLGCELKEAETKHFADGFHEGEWEKD